MEHPIMPPPELVAQWINDAFGPNYVTTAAAQWGADQQLKLDAEQIAHAYQAGADQELEACCEWLDRNNQWAKVDIDELRDARRPKPLSLQEQALDALQSMRISPELIAIINANTDLKNKYETIRSALEALPND